MSNKEKLAFKKANYILMFAGIGALTIGFYIMTLDKEDYGFGFLGITLGPLVVMIGFIIEFFAIFYKSKK
jgi:hypothetical protein